MLQMGVDGKAFQILALILTQIQATILTTILVRSYTILFNTQYRNHHTTVLMISKPLKNRRNGQALPIKQTA